MSGYRKLALSLLLGAVDDVTGRDRTDLEHVIYRDTTKGKWKELKDNALDFFFSKESEPHCIFWCSVANLPISRFRTLLKKYR